ncbi:MAG: CHAP domain-containing protein [Pseudomonadota bacterium]
MSYLSRINAVALLILATASPSWAQEESPAACSVSVASLSASEAPITLVWSDYGEEFDSYLGVPAISNGPGDSEKYYQCTEYVHRYLNETFGVETALGMGLGHGKDLARNIGERFADQSYSSEVLPSTEVSLQYFENGSSGCLPSTGSVVSMEIGRYGHVAVIRDMIEMDDGSRKATFIAQHGGMYNSVGATIRPGEMTFVQSDDGTWSGSWKSPLNNTYDAVGWLVPVEEARAE